MPTVDDALNKGRLRYQELVWTSLHDDGMTTAGRERLEQTLVKKDIYGIEIWPFDFPIRKVNAATACKLPSQSQVIEIIGAHSIWKLKDW